MLGKVISPDDGGTGGGTGEGTGGGTGDNDVINPYVRIKFSYSPSGYSPDDYKDSPTHATSAEAYTYFKVNGVDIKGALSSSTDAHNGVTITASSDRDVTYSTLDTTPIRVEIKFSDFIDPSMYLILLNGIATIGSDRTISFVLQTAT